MKKQLKLLLLFTLIRSACLAQTDREFWFAVPQVDDNKAQYNIPVVVRMTSFAAPATVTLSLPANPSFIPISISLPANSTQSIDLSQWLDLLQTTPSNTLQNKGLLIQSTADITAYYEVVSSYCGCNPEVFSLKGRNALGNEFYISSQYTYNIDTVRAPAATTSFDMVATKDHTTITVTPAQPIVGHAANIPFTLVLNKGQTYSATGLYRDLDHHLQGSHIVSDQPIAVTVKDDLVRGDGNCDDLIGDQTIPTNVTGSEYVVSKGYLVPKDRVFVLAITDNTPIFLDGNASASVNLNKGQSWTFDLSNPSTYLRSNKNFYVYQVTGNGCELGSAIIPKINCTGSSSVSVVRSSNDRFGVMLITKDGNQGSFTVNGDPAIIGPGNFTPVPGTGGVYVAGTIDLSAYLPAGSVFNFSNPAGKFSMGFINGDAKEGCRYGFFSDYKASNVSTTQIEICPNGSTRLNAFGGVSYEWSPAASLSDPHIADPVATPSVTTRYKALITEADGCQDSAFVNVSIRPAPVFHAPPDTGACTGAGVVLASANAESYIYQWSPATGLDDPSAPYPMARPAASTVYTLKISDPVCAVYNSSFTVRVTITGGELFVVPNAFTPNGDGHNDCFGITHWGDVTIEELSIFNRLGLRVFTTRNPSDCWDGAFRGHPQPTGVYAYVIRAHTFCGEVTRTGTLTLIR
jgi:gliding motility-associated-like protein